MDVKEITGFAPVAILVDGSAGIVIRREIQTNKLTIVTSDAVTHEFDGASFSPLGPGEIYQRLIPPAPLMLTNADYLVRIADTDLADDFQQALIKMVVAWTNPQGVPPIIDNDGYVYFCTQVPRVLFDTTTWLWPIYNTNSDLPRMMFGSSRGSSFTTELFGFEFKLSPPLCAVLEHIGLSREEFAAHVIRSGRRDEYAYLTEELVIVVALREGLLELSETRQIEVPK